MVDVDDVVHVWSRSGNRTPNDRLGLYARALSADRPIGPYRTLDDEQEDRAILALWRVDRPHATIADVHQAPPLALSRYHQLLHDLARGGLGPLSPGEAPSRGAWREARRRPESGAKNCDPANSKLLTINYRHGILEETEGAAS